MTLVLVAYLCVGLLLALWMSTHRDAEDWGTGAWLYVVCLWPHYTAQAVPPLCRLGLARLARAEVAVLSWAVGVATRRLARRGCRFTVE